MMSRQGWPVLWLLADSGFQYIYSLKTAEQYAYTYLFSFPYTHTHSHTHTHTHTHTHRATLSHSRTKIFMTLGLDPKHFFFRWAKTCDSVSWNVRELLFIWRNRAFALYVGWYDYWHLWYVLGDIGKSLHHRLGWVSVCVWPIIINTFNFGSGFFSRVNHSFWLISMLSCMTAMLPEGR